MTYIAPIFSTLEKVYHHDSSNSSSRGKNRGIKLGLLGHRLLRFYLTSVPDAITVQEQWHITLIPIYNFLSKNWFKKTISHYSNLDFHAKNANLRANQIYPIWQYFWTIMTTLAQCADQREIILILRWSKIYFWHRRLRDSQSQRFRFRFIHYCIVFLRETIFH